MRCGSTEPAKTYISSKLLFGPEIETPFGLITDATLALRRDMWERKILAQVASQAFSPLVTFTDGPIELYAGRVQEGTELSEYQKNLGDYLQELNKLCEMGVITVGYIDKPRSALVVRLLELLMLSEEELEEKPRPRPLNGVRDIYLIEQFLEGRRAFRSLCSTIRKYPNIYRQSGPAFLLYKYRPTRASHLGSGGNPCMGGRRT